MGQVPLVQTKTDGWGRVLNPDAERIARLPHAHHPALAGIVAKCADTPRLAFVDALDIVEIAREAAGITVLDVEMMSPANQTFVPMEPTRNLNESERFQERVSYHVARQVGGPGHDNNR
jgi:hypothetical protein